MEKQFIQTPRLKFHYRVQGKPDAPPMLLLHGEFGSGRWWEPLFEVLPDDILAIAPDLRGTGQTEKPADGYSLDEQRLDLEALVDALALRDFDLVAHSAAGALAVEFALKHQHRLASLTLISSVPMEGVHSPIDTLMVLEQMRDDHQLLAQSMALLMSSFFPSILNGNIENAYTDDYAQSRFFKQLVSDATAMAPPLFTSFAESLNHWNRFAEANDLTLPALIIWGDQDPIVSQDAATRTLIAIPGAANLEILRSIGHSPMIEDPLRLAERVIDFIVGDHAGFSEIRDSM